MRKNTTPPNPQAFPRYEMRTAGSERGMVCTGGMTLRDYFAAAAMSRLIENTTSGHDGYLKDFQGQEDEHDLWVRTRAYEIADAMLLERSIPTPPPANPSPPVHGCEN